jgi:hypothetical protein
MAKEPPLSLLKQCLSDAHLKGGMINVKSLKLDNLSQIIKNKSYDQGVDYQILWDTLFSKSLKVTDFQNRTSRPLTEVEKETIAKSTDDQLSNIPYKYTFYYRLPDNYPGEYKKLTANFEIKGITQELVDQLTPKITEKGLAGALRKSEIEEHIPVVGKPYIVIKDKGYIRTGALAFLESRYTPDRLVGLYYSLQAVGGFLDTYHYARHYYTPKVYADNNKFIANYPNPLRNGRAEMITFTGSGDEVNNVNELFTKLITTQGDKEEEKARVQICNALYWIMEFLNAGELSLQSVFLVSAIDSLFPTRNHTVTNRMISLTSDDKSSIIAEVIADSEKEKVNNIQVLEKLFEKRNLTIHGQIEIHGFSKSKMKETRENRQIVEYSERIFRNYIITRLQRYG